MQPPALQSYSFIASTTNVTIAPFVGIDFDVWYQTENPIYDTASKITALYLYGQPYKRFSSRSSPQSLHDPDAPSLTGPWSFTGPSTDSEDTQNMLAWTVFMSLQPQPRPPQMFFRIADPVGRCPCEWNTNCPDRRIVTPPEQQLPVIFIYSSRSLSDMKPVKSLRAGRC